MVRILKPLKNPLLGYSNATIMSESGCLVGPGRIAVRGQSGGGNAQVQLKI